MRLRQREAFKERWEDKDGAEISLHGRLEASEERDMRLRQRGREKPSRRDGKMRRGVSYKGD